MLRPSFPFSALARAAMRSPVWTHSGAASLGSLGIVDDTPRVRYYGGLDLGPVHDFTALAVLERTQDPRTPGREGRLYAVRHLERFQPGTPYSHIFARVAQRFAGPPLGQAPLAADQTAVGRPVIDLLRRTARAVRVRPVLITTGHQAVQESGVTRVPKAELVAVLQVLLQSRRLRVAPGLPEAAVLERELASFRAKPTLSATEEDAWREGRDDDVVLAVGIAAWLAERGTRELRVL